MAIPSILLGLPMIDTARFRGLPRRFAPRNDVFSFGASSFCQPAQGRPQADRPTGKRKAQPFGWAWWTGWLWVRRTPLRTKIDFTPSDPAAPGHLPHLADAKQGRLGPFMEKKKPLDKRKSPTFRLGLVDDIGLEPMTFRTSSGCSSQLS